MANRQRGEVDIEINGKTYTLELSLDAMVSVEDLYSTPQKEVTFQEISERAEAGSMRHLKGYLWALLREHHPEIQMSGISKFVKDAGGLAGIQLALLKVAKGSLPDAEDIAELGVGEKPNPPHAQVVKRAGTGASSGSKPAAVA